MTLLAGLRKCQIQSKNYIIGLEMKTYLRLRDKAKQQLSAGLTCFDREIDFSWVDL